MPLLQALVWAGLWSMKVRKPFGEAERGGPKFGSGKAGYGMLKLVTGNPEGWALEHLISEANFLDQGKVKDKPAASPLYPERGRGTRSVSPVGLPLLGSCFWRADRPGFPWSPHPLPLTCTSPESHAWQQLDTAPSVACWKEMQSPHPLTQTHLRQNAKGTL